MSESELISYKFHGIEEPYSILNKRPDEFDGKVYTFSVSVTEKADEVRELLVLFVNIKIFNEDSSILLADMEVACGFNIENFSKHIKKNDIGVFDVPEKLSTTLSVISISTARGYVFSKLKGTYLHKAVLPIISGLKKEK